MNLSLVIPFYNEQENIKVVVDGLVNSFEQASIEYELVLVNNGSVDASPQILEDLAKEKQKTIKIVHVQINQGYGWGIINGLKNATGEFVGFMSGDGQINTESVLRVLECIRNENYDLVKVNRVVRHDGMTRRVLSLLYNFLFWVLFNVKTKDVNGSPKVLRRELLNVIDPISKDWFIDAEIMIKAKYLNLNVEELPTEFLRRKKGRSHVKFTTIFEFVRNMLDYRFSRRMREWRQEVPKL